LAEQAPPDRPLQRAVRRCSACSAAPRDHPAAEYRLAGASPGRCAGAGSVRVAGRRGPGRTGSGRWSRATRASLSRSGTAGAATRRSAPVTSTAPACPRPWPATPASGPASSASAEPPSPNPPAQRPARDSAGASISGDLTRHRRRRPTQPSGDHSQRQPSRQAAGDLLPLGQAQAQLPASLRHRPDPAGALEQIPHRRGVATHLARQHLHRLPRPPAAPDLIDLRRRQRRPHHPHHPIPFARAKIMKCCDDPLRPPA
jgi:hypothetical protein